MCYISQDECIEILGERLNVRGHNYKNGKGGYDARRCPACGGSDCLSIDPGDKGTPVLICRSTGCRGEDIIKAIRAEGLPFPGPSAGYTNVPSMQEDAQKRRKLQEAEQAARHEEAARRAKTIYENATGDAAKHPYTLRKKLDFGPLVRCGKWLQKGWENALLVPFYDETEAYSLRAPSTLQAINADGEKNLLKGGRKRGCFYLLGQPSDGFPVYIGEGLATVAAVHQASGSACLCACDAGNLSPVAEAAHRLWPNVDIVILEDNDAAGREQSAKAARAVGGKVAKAADGLRDKQEHGDFWDVLDEGGKDAVVEALKQAKHPEEASLSVPEDTQNAAETSTDAAEETANAAFDIAIGNLAALSTKDYEQQRKAAAKELDIRTSVLDTLVSQQRQAGASEELPFEVTKPWAEPVNPAELLDSIEKIIHRFIFCTPEIAVAATLWAAFTWFIHVVHVAPIALITAPDKQCGKTQLLSLLSRLSSRSISASGISPAALFRAIEEWQPTIFIDEADAFMKGNEELRCVINSGHTRDTALVIRTVGDDHVPKGFGTWGAKAIAGIKVERIAPTVTDRAIVFPLRRRAKTETVERLRNADPELFWTLRSKLARFAVDEAEKVASAHVNISELEELTDRQCDNWEPLLAIAGVAGGQWPEKAKAAALALSKADEDSTGVGQELLENIEEIFNKCDNNPLASADRITTHDLLKALCESEEWRWSTYNRGREINARQIASILRGYGIRTNATINLGGEKRAKGYLRADFADAFSRYLPKKTQSDAVSTHIV